MKSASHRTTAALKQLTLRYHWLLAGLLLAVMAGLGYTSMIGDSAIVDEVAHIPAAYSYWHYGDMRLNPEHPPLIKDLAGLPLQFLPLKFPDQLAAWTTDVNGQWESGWNFLYHIGNNADLILFWSRLPILVLGVAFGAVFYRYVRRRWGTAAGLLALLFYALSPNILAHAHYVTTDLGATIFIFIALAAFVRFVEQPSRQNVVILSVALAAANLAKFSAVLLYPFLGVMTLIVIVLWRRPLQATARRKRLLGGFLGAAALSVIWIWLYYVPHTINMPEAVQDRLISGVLTQGLSYPVGQVLMAINGFDPLRPLVQYILGVTMVYVRFDGGNVTYFAGAVTSQSFHGYFPVLFMVKTQVALLLLGLATFGVALARLRVGAHGLGRRVAESFRGHLALWVLGSFGAFYFAISVLGNLNLGIRHILPVYLPMFVLVAVGTVTLYRQLTASPKWRPAAAGVLTALLVWYAGSTIAAHPHYLSYFNELIGGPNNADQFFSDSNVDWGQDLRRLKTYVSEHPEIKRIGFDYFGGGDPRYYFCHRLYDPEGQLIATAAGYDCTGSVYQEWHSEYGQYTGQYLAVSETFLENDRYYAAVRGESGYTYLRAMKPIAKVGASINIYKLY